MTRKVTMEQIAAHAGVSKYAVSKALSGKSGVSEETRAKIVRIATQLGYFLQERVQQKVSPSIKAFEPRKFSESSIMVLMPNIRMQNMDSHYWGRIIDGIADEVRKVNLSMIIVTEHSVENFSNVINVKNLLGLIGVGTISNSMLLEIRKLGSPFVLVDHEDSSIPCDTVFINNYEGAYQVTNHLIGLHHTRFQFVGDIHFARSFHDRWIGFRSALEESRLPLHQDERLLQVSGLTGDEQHHIRASLELLSQQELMPTAMVCANDDIARCVIGSLLQMDLKVPDDVSVSGFDNLDKARDFAPTLTTINVAKEALGRRAVEMLLHRLSDCNSPREKILLMGDPVFRASTSIARDLATNRN